MTHVPLPALLLLALSLACAPRVAADAADPGDPYTLAGTTHLLDGHPPLAAEGWMNVVVEIPAGTNAKWEVDKSDGLLRWERVDGHPRVVQYLPYPGNYGMVPRTLLPEAQGGDGDPLDVIVLGPALERGAVVAARPIGVLRLLDDGEQDDKILAVQRGAPLDSATDLADLERRFPGVLRIVEIWFTSYKGPGRLRADGYGDRAEAEAILAAAIRAYAAHATHATR